MRRGWSISLEVRLFVTLWLATSAFFSGGGWNQNARFAQIRSIAETGRLEIDDYLVYSVGERVGSDWRLERAEIREGRFQRDGSTWALAWEGSDGPVPITGTRTPTTTLVTPVQVAASGDLTYARGHLFPNKAPGAVFAGVPAYFLIQRIERGIGLDPDRWWILNLNAWWTTAWSVGWWAALAGVIFFRLASELLGGDRRTALGATIAFALGSSFWPQATLLQEQILSAALLLGAVWALGGARPRAAVATWRCAGAGVAVAAAITSSYVAVLGGLALGGFLILRDRRPRSWGAFALGAAVGLVPLLAYHGACFGSPLATGYSGQNPAFLSSSALLGVLEVPPLSRLAALLFSPFRGWFVTSPILIAALYGLLLAGRERTRRPAVALALAVALAYLLFNLFFTGWHGGWSSYPRYLVPAIPFLALGLPFALRRRPRQVLALAALSIAAQFLVTSVDPQAPVGVSPLARVPNRALWRTSPMTDHVLPILGGGRSAGRLGQLLDGPVSANPIGVVEGWIGQVFPPGSREARWASFNAGELVFPGSRWSLLVVALPLILLGWWTLRAGTGGNRRSGAGAGDAEDEERSTDASQPLAAVEEGAP